MSGGMKELWFRDADRERDGNRDPFDPILEGERQRLDRELSLALWERACAESTDRVGRLDPARAKQRFHELVVLLVAGGGPVRPAVGKRTRVDAMGRDGEAWHVSERSPRAPGRETRVIAEARRWIERGEELAELTEASARPAGTRQELPGASEVRQAMRSLQAPPGAGQPTRLEDALGTRMSRLFGVDLTGTRVVPDSPAATGATKAVTQDGEVHFRAGAYRPGTPQGDWLIAHELAHVVQQRADRGERTGTTKEIEREADRAATLVSRGSFAPIALRAQPAAAYAFHEGEAHDEVGDDATEDTRGAHEPSPEKVNAKPDAPASPPDEAHHATDAGADGHEDAGEHDALTADEHAISAPLPAEDAPGGAPAGGGGPAPKPQKEAPSVASAKPEAGLAQLHGVRPDKLTLLFGQVRTANTADVGKERAAQKANPPRQMSTGEAAT
ncbi:MAG TPA: DUF4157 domain-containing protein, partial [Kofleriaceae bacterium]|nr:DUF4157 domain-containing protein [Kofleriaceae bacterium]